MENDAETASTDAESEIAKKAAERIDPLLNLLNVPNIEINKDEIRKYFILMWESEKGEDLDPDEQILNTVGLFIYYSHNILSDQNIKPDKGREYILEALTKWMEPETEKYVQEEKATDDPFKAFVENNIPRVDERYSWRNFLLDHKKSDEKEWTYKMKKCWFYDFFIRFGRPDYIKTACAFDQIPAEARKDYVDLKLQNLFAKLGSTCQFAYKPAKK